MNLKESYYTFTPKIDWRLGRDRKTTGETQVLQKILTDKWFSIIKKIFSPQPTGEGETSGIQRFF